MAKSKKGNSFWAELLSVRLYKRNQGRLTRQLTAVGAALIVFFGAYTASRGVLGGFVNSFYRVTVVCSEPSSDALAPIAAQHGGAIGRVTEELDGEKVEVQFATSHMWSTDADLQDEMRKSAGDFIEAVNSQLKSVRVSKPTHVVHDSVAIQIGVPALFSALSAWIIFRLVNYPLFADFLISVEAEMDKVTWSSRQQLIRATIVVIVTMVVLGCLLLTFDMIWQWFFELIGFLQIAA